MENTRTLRIETKRKEARSFSLLLPMRKLTTRFLRSWILNIHEHKKFLFGGGWDWHVDTFQILFTFNLPKTILIFKLQLFMISHQVEPYIDTALMVTIGIIVEEETTTEWERPYITGSLILLNILTFQKVYVFRLKSIKYFLVFKF